MTDEPPPEGQKYVMDLLTEEERRSDAEAVDEALSETDSLDAHQLAGNTGLEEDCVVAALQRLQREGRVKLSVLSDGTVVASRLDQ